MAPVASSTVARAPGIGQELGVSTIAARPRCFECRVQPLRDWRGRVAGESRSEAVVLAETASPDSRSTSMRPTPLTLQVT